VPVIQKAIAFWVAESVPVTSLVGQKVIAFWGSRITSGHRPNWKSDRPFSQKRSLALRQSRSHSEIVEKAIANSVKSDHLLGYLNQLRVTSPFGQKAITF